MLGVLQGQGMIPFGSCPLDERCDVEKGYTDG